MIGARSLRRRSTAFPKSQLGPGDMDEVEDKTGRVIAMRLDTGTAPNRQNDVMLYMEE